MNKFKQILSANLFLLKRKSVILRRSSNALGDNLMLSFLARAIKKQFPVILVGVESSRPELFYNNPNIDRVYSEKVSAKYHKLQYQINKNTKKHILNQLAENYSNELNEVERKVEIFSTDSEILDAKEKFPGSYIAVSAEGKQSFASNRKEWGFVRFTELLRSLSQFKFVQVGAEKDVLLPNVVDARGLSIRKTAAVISNSQTGIFLEGGLMHLSDAVNKPSVIIFGGALDPEITGYSIHTNIATSPVCSPCFTSHQAMEKCDTMICMKEISVDQVANAVRKLIQNEKSG